MRNLKRLFRGRISGMDEKAYGATDAGRKREGNEDSYRVLMEKDLYIVADGMGGHNAGEVASLNAVKKVEEYFTSERISEMRGDREKIKGYMIDALIEAHKGIIEMARTKTEYLGMGCTIALSFIHDNLLHTCHVGDSRIYIINQADIIQITIDHSYVGELVRAGKMTSEEARHSPLKSQITQALGAPSPINPEYHQHPLKRDDRVLLCSDGLWDMLSDVEIQAIVMEGRTLEETCKRLIEKANEAGGDDNITVVLVKNG